MATKASAGSRTAAARKAPAKRRAAKRGTGAARGAGPAAAPGSDAGTPEPRSPGQGAFAQMPKLPRMLTPEQAIEMYKANARMALDVINAAIEGTERVRRKQFEGVAAARDFQTKQARSAAQATDAQSLMAMGQGAAQEALQRSMHYWGEMFELIVEIQKRLFTLIEEQTQGVPGVKEARAAMALMPDLGQMQKVVAAMQGVLSSGGSAFEGMQRVMGDFARMAQGSMPGGRR